ncbi:MAG: UDP-3-O-[3-hydroxymyristoyl] N-acetylglucosamine deacetylase, partial [Betaproteobacteria bacterium]|nr:UDP-3-O-[3-hydroxymyristoyl] N-acetylglucosamine deacetylase [Betaproteobacteria bacterium]
MLRQRTLRSPVFAEGLGLHSGRRVRLDLIPAAADHGVVFRRGDLPAPNEIVSGAAAVGDTRLASTVSSGDVRVATVEHLMSALSGLGVDNVVVEVDAEEVPIM